jgi:MFS family permease
VQSETSRRNELPVPGHPTILREGCLTASGPAHPGRRLMERAAAWLPLRNGVFGRLWFLSLVSGSLVSAQDVATRWIVHRASTSAFLLSLVPTLSSTAFFLLTFPGGILADRFPRNRLLSVIYFGLASGSAALGVVSFFPGSRAPMALGLSLIFGAGLALSAPVWAALLVDTVQKADLETAVALSGTQLNLSSILGPALAGLLLSRMGPEAVFLTGGITFVAVSGAARFWWPVKDRPTARCGLRQALLEVARVLHWRAHLRTVIFRSALFSFFIAVVPTLLPVFGLKDLKISSGELGLLFTALGAGSIVGGVLLVPLLQRKLSSNAMTEVACLWLALALYLVDIVRQKPVFFVVAAAAGMAWTIAASEIWASGQRATPDASRGKINALLMMSGSGAMALGGLTWAAVAAAGVGHAIQAASIALLLSLPLRLRWSLDG